jgi:hypothetical protein
MPQNCTWSWKKILKLRDIAERFFKFSVGNGKTFIYGWIGGTLMVSFMNNMDIG